MVIVYGALENEYTRMYLSGSSDAHILLLVLVEADVGF